MLDMGKIIREVPHYNTIATISIVAVTLPLTSACRVLELIFGNHVLLQVSHEFEQLLDV